MTSEQAYRERLEADLVRWQADGVITSATAAAIRRRLGPIGEGITITTVVAIVGGLLIAASALAFVAANWSAIARPTRLGLLLAGIAAAYVVGGLFDRGGRTVLADLSTAVGAIIFGAAIALVGQMYHLAEDFAAGLLLWSCGVMLAAILTGSRGALAVALAAGCIWSATRAFELSDVHVPFVALWLVAASLALAWNAPVARHLVSIAAVAWWLLCAIGLGEARSADPLLAFSAGAASLLGCGLVLASSGSDSSRAFGLTLSNYGAMSLAVAVAGMAANLFSAVSFLSTSPWIIGNGGAGLVLALAAAAIGRRTGPLLAAVAIGCAMVVATGWFEPTSFDEPWHNYALALAAMVSLVVSGMLDDVRARAVAGWIGLAAVIAAITWTVRGSLIGRAAFLAVAGAVAIGLAGVLGRIWRRERLQ